MKVGVLGGTFDPVHIGHLLLAEQARSQIPLDKVLFVPAGQPWRKGSRFVSAAGHRVAMVELALRGVAEFEVALVEVERPGPSYTVDTVVDVQAAWPGAELFLVLGVDALLDLPVWREPERIVALAKLAVAGRPGFAVPSGGELEGQVAGIGDRIVWLDMPPVGVSASDIRRRVRAGQSIRFLVPPAVEEYIWRHRLYLT